MQLIILDTPFVPWIRRFYVSVTKVMKTRAIDRFASYYVRSIEKDRFKRDRIIFRVSIIYYGATQLNIACALIIAKRSL